MAGRTRTIETGVVAAFREHESALRAFVSRLVASRDDVDDVTQEAFLRAFNAEKARRVRRPRSFLFTIARNLVLSDFARKSNQLTESMADLDDLTVLDDCTLDTETRHPDRSAFGGSGSSLETQLVAKGAQSSV